MPAELIFGRKMITVLTLLEPEKEHQVSIKQVRRSFWKGENVYAKVYSRNKWSWAAGVVIEWIGKVNYTILLTDIQAVPEIHGTSYTRIRRYAVF